MREAVNAIIRQYDFNLQYAHALVADVSAEQMTLLPGPGLVNHPAFTLGHLVTGSAMVAAELGGAEDLPEGWNELFARMGPNDQTRPDKDVTKYPPKEALLTELSRQHARVNSLLLQASASALSQPVKWRFAIHMPSMIDVVTFMCISHEAMHLGQLAAWRRAMGMPAALMTL